jgi:phthiocerol/phenolphthiocerol synthesis type-I polyketide synthase C
MRQIYFLGRACRLPGAGNMDAFRAVLRDGRCTVSSVPQDRWNHDLMLHPEIGVQGKSYTFAAGVLDDIWGFDLSVFGLSPREAMQMDPQQRLLLQVVWEALEDARIDPATLSGQRVGVYVGASSMDHGALLGQDPGLIDPYMMTGNTLSLLANRISHVFDLRGPSFVVDTACSSSLVALDLARQALAAADIDTAIVAGVSLLMSPVSFAGFSAARMLSPTGLCRPFSERADGYVRAEGSVAFVLRASQSAPPGSCAVLIDSETNADGRTINVALPAEEGQFQLLDRLYRRAGIAPDRLDFVEAHGTGTLVGDPIEAHALGRAIARGRSRPLPIGSVKSNIGHLEPASGLAGILKTLVAFEDRIVPQSLHAQSMNPHIDFDALNLIVTRTALPLPGGRDLVAGVSSFGFGGVNAHCILRSVSPPQTPAPAGTGSRPGSAPAPAPGPGPQGDRLFVTSAFCEPALRDLAQAYAQRFATDAQALDAGGLVDQAWAARGLHPRRLAVLAPTPAVAATALTAFATGQKSSRVLRVDSQQREARVVFAYSGNGGQYAGMSRLALRADAAYRAAFEQIDALFESRAGVSLQTLVDAPSLARDLEDCTVAQALLFADQAAQTLALAARGLTPDAVIGHSGGEVAAAWACGALDLTQAVDLVVTRSRIVAPLAGAGAMAALQVGATEAQALLDEFNARDPDLPPPARLAIAAINSPRSVTIVGPRDMLTGFSRWVRATYRLASVILAVNYPYHSALQDPLEGEMKAALARLHPGHARCPVYSGTRGGKVSGPDLGVDYWWENLRRPVLFAQAFQSAIDDGLSCFFEIGPQPVLGNYLTDTASDAQRSVTVTHSLSMSDPDDVNPVARAAARALLSGCRFSGGAGFAPPDVARVPLPPYPWQQTRLCAIDTARVQSAMGTEAGFHPLLGSGVATGLNAWRRDLDDKMIPSLRDHRVGHSSLLPGTAFAEMIYAAACKASGTAAVDIRDLDIATPLVLSGKSGIEIQTSVEIETGRVLVKSRNRLSADPFRIHAAARYVTLSTPPAAPTQAPPAPMRAEDSQGLWVYKHAAALGLHYGPAFQGLTALRTEGDLFEMTLREDLGLGASQPIHGFDPVQADCLLHGLISATLDKRIWREGRAFVPVRIARVQVYARGQRVTAGRLVVRRRGQQSLLVDVTGFAADGGVVFSFEGLRLRAVQIQAPIRFDRHAYHLASRRVLNHPAAVASQGAQAWPGIPAGDSAADEAAQEEEIALLMDAAVHQAIWSALSGRCDADGVYRRRHSDHDAEPHLLGMIAAFGLAQPGTDPDSWTIAPDCDLPDSGTMALALLHEHPSRVAELTVLLQLPQALADFLHADAPVPAETLFGREALLNLARLDHGAGTRLRGVLGHLAAQIVQQDATRGLRVGFVGPVPQGLGMFVTAHPQIEALRLLRPGEDGMTPLPWCRDIGPDRRAVLDVLVVTDPADLLGGGRAEHWVTRLAPGGHLVCFCPRKSALERVIASCGATPPGPDPDPETIAGRLSGLALHIEARSPLPGADLAGEILIARASAPEQAAELAPELAPELADMQPEAAHPPRAGGADWVNRCTRIWQRLHGDCETRAGELSALCPVQPGAPCLVISPGAGSIETLAAAVLSLRDLALWAHAQARPLVAILPRGAQWAGSPPADPVQHGLWAMLRTVANEVPGLVLRLIDPAGAADVEDMTLSDLLRAAMPGATEETEIVLRPGGIDALRVVQGLPQGAAVTPGDPTGARLVLPTSGRLDDLTWQACPRPAPGPGEVEIEIAATGLNYRDVMWAMGLLPEEALETGFAGPTLGLECAGQVVRVGAGVTALAPGDRVMAFGPACLSTHLLMHQDWVTRLPATISLDQAAALPVAYFTAFHALVTLGRLQAGETIVIHGGAGGVGLAAVAIARDRGARIIATAGSPVKQTLLRKLGVDHVLSSRSNDFADQVRALTDGAGVDMVLNSLFGQAMEQSLSLLRPFGRFLELGKQDYYANTAIGLRALKDNITYFGIDVDSYLAARPDAARRDFAEVMAALAQGRYPVLPHQILDADAATEAFRLMQRSGHIGKILLRPPAAPTSAAPGPVAIAPAPAPFAPDPTRWHVIAGGLGGLGLETAEWLYQHGARKFALLGRSASPATDDVAQRLNRLRASGADLRVLACDITDRVQLDHALDLLRSEAPLASVYHAAMVLEDRALAEIDAELLSRVLPVKTIGLRHLDLATRADPIEAFVAYTSLASLIGNPGQAAYVAANACQEAIMAARAAQGLPALAVAWGAISDAGHVTRDATLGRVLDRMSGNVRFDVAVALNALCDLLTLPGAGTCVTITPMKWAAASAALPLLHRPTHDVLRRLAEAGGGVEEAGNLRAEIKALPAAKAIKRIAAFLKTEIANILRIPADTLAMQRPLAEYGMDSLMGVELSLSAQAALGDDLPMPSLGEDLTIQRLSEIFVTHIQTGPAPDAVQVHSSPGQPVPLRADRGPGQEAAQ